MSYESAPFSTPDGEKKTVRIYDTDNPLRKHVVPPEGPAVYREQLTAELGGKAIDDIFLYRPDVDETERASEVPVVKMGGLWTIGHHYTKQAIDMAQHGHDFATFVPNFDYPVWRPLYDPALLKSPYVWHAKNGRQVIKAVLAHTEANQARVSGHSYAGYTVTELIARFPELVETVVLEDPAGIKLHSLRPKKLWNDELKPALQIMGEDLPLLPPNTKERSIRRITDHGVHAAREFIGLSYPRTDMKWNLRKARQYGVPVGLLLLSQSAIFDAAAIRQIAEENQMFDTIDEVNEFHIAPNIRPAAVDLAEIAMFNTLSRLDKAA